MRLRSPLIHKALASLAALLIALTPMQAMAFSRIKDLVDVEGIRDNMLVGYGLVVGLNGSGDSLSNAPFTQQSIQTMLERLGVNTRGEHDADQERRRRDGDGESSGLRARKARVSTFRSARWATPKACKAAHLLVTPLFGADGQIYALGQGPVAIGGFSAQGEGASVTRGVPTAGRIANGAIVEREIRLPAGKPDDIAPVAAQSRSHHRDAHCRSR